MQYLIGDIQGCYEPLQRLLAKIGFSPSRDTLYPLGDLVNRGPASAAVLRYLRELDGAAQCLLGNHDIFMLAVSQGLRPAHRTDTFNDVLQAPDATELLHWVRQQALALALDQRTLLVHAGVLPQWSIRTTIKLAGELETALRCGDWAIMMRDLFAGGADSGREWHDSLQGPERLRVIVNALTRLRFCSADGRMEFSTKEGGSQAQPPAGYAPWFEAPHRATHHDCIAFGHWSTLGLKNTSTLKSLDTGCIWGGELTALCWETQEVVQVAGQ